MLGLPPAGIELHVSASFQDDLQLLLCAQAAVLAWSTLYETSYSFFVYVGLALRAQQEG